MKLLKTVSEMDYAAIVRDPGYVLDSTRVHKYRVFLREGRAMPAVFISSLGCICLDGEHRLEACKLEGKLTGPACVYEPDNIRDGRIFQLQTNGHRRTLTPEETAELVQLLTEEEADKQQALEGGDAQLKDSVANKSKPSKTRGRPSEGKGKAVERAAKATGDSERTVRRRLKKVKAAKDENTDPVSAEMLKPPPSLQSRLSRAAVDLKAAVEKLTGVFKEMDGLRPGYGPKDSRWAVLGAVNQALRFALTSSASVDSAQLFMGRIESAKNSKGGRKTPVDAYDVKRGKEMLAAGDPDVVADEAELGQAEEAAAKHRDVLAKIADAAKPVAERGAPEPLPAVDYDPTLCPACDESQVADGYCHACGTPVEVEKKPLGLSDAPKVGLRVPAREKKLTVVAVDGEGNEMPFEEALAMADAAGVGGGPPDEVDEDDCPY